jgi:hypothetical protein
LPNGHYPSPEATESEERTQPPTSLPDLVPEKSVTGNSDNLCPAEKLKMPPPRSLRGKKSARFTASRGGGSSLQRTKSPKPRTKKKEPPITAAENIWLFEGFKSKANFFESIGFSISGGGVFSSQRKARDDPFRANEEENNQTRSEPPELSEEEIQKLRDVLPYFEEDDDRVRERYRCLAAAIPPGQ